MEGNFLFIWQNNDRITMRRWHCPDATLASTTLCSPVLQKTMASQGHMWQKIHPHGLAPPPALPTLKFCCVFIIPFLTLIDS